MWSLSEDSAYYVEVDPHFAPFGFDWVHWAISTHTLPYRLGLVVLAGSRARFDPLMIVPGTALAVVLGTAHADPLSSDGLEAVISFRPVTESGYGEPIEVLRHPIMGFDPAQPWEKLIVPMDRVAGQAGALVVGCDAGPCQDPTGDWLAIYELAAAPVGRMGLCRARAFKEYRIRGEKELFSAMHADDCGDASLPPLLTLDDTPPAYAGNYCIHRLSQRLNRPEYDFRRRLHERVAAIDNDFRPQEILSLCCGPAKFERQLLEGLPGVKPHVTLLDINPDLLRRAEKRMSSVVTAMELIACDINELDLGGRRFDLVLCQAGLHHVVELERVSAAIASALAPGGEFWSVSEYVGRRGNRLWPEAYAIADEFFSALEPKYRRNWGLGGEAVVVDHLLNYDCSLASFEGIRSDELENCLAAELEPIWKDRRNCFLWQLFSPSYAPNWNSALDWDRQLIERAIELEYQHYIQGGRASFSSGIYRAINA